MFEKKDRYVVFLLDGMTFSVVGPRNITKILEEHPEAANDFLMLPETCAQWFSIFLEYSCLDITAARMFMF